MTHNAESAAPALEFGQQVEFTRTLTRRSGPGENGAWHIWRKFWTAEGYPGQPEPEPCKGIVIGRRHLSNGDNTGGGWEDPIWYRPKERFVAYLIAYDIRRKPVLVLPEHITPLPPGATS